MRPNRLCSLAITTLLLMAVACQNDGPTDAAGDADDSTDVRVGDTSTQRPDSSSADTRSPLDSAVRDGMDGVSDTGADGDDAMSDTADTTDTADASEAMRPAVWVAPDGDDNNPGTQSQPFATFDHALQNRPAGHDIRVKAGTYTERLDVDIDGSAADPIRVLAASGARPVIDVQDRDRPAIELAAEHAEVRGFEAANSEIQCVRLLGNHLVAGDLLVHDCVSHGVQVAGRDVVVEDSEIYETVLENQGEQGAWGSALKVREGGKKVVLRRNEIYENWGEGIAVTRGINTTVARNLVYDNYSVNIYIDNSYDVVVEKNLAYCTPNSGFERDGTRPSGFAIGEESYSGWGAQLHDVTIRNNIATSCDRGLITYSGEVSGAGLQNVRIVHNTFWNSVDTALSIGSDTAKQQNTLIANNLVQQPDDKVAYIDDPTGLTLRNNFWVGGTPPMWTNARGMNDKSGDPKLAAPPGKSAKSFRLSKNSPARDAAFPSTGANDDLDGRSRDSTPDIGALEFVPLEAPSPFDELWN